MNRHDDIHRYLLYRVTFTSHDLSLVKVHAVPIGYRSYRLTIWKQGAYFEVVECEVGGQLWPLETRLSSPVEHMLECKCTDRYIVWESPLQFPQSIHFILYRCLVGKERSREHEPWLSYTVAQTMFKKLVVYFPFDFRSLDSLGSKTKISARTKVHGEWQRRRRLLTTWFNSCQWSCGAKIEQWLDRSYS